MTPQRPIGNFSKIIYSHFGDFSDGTVRRLFRFAALASATARLFDTDVSDRMFAPQWLQHLWRPVRRFLPLMVPLGETRLCGCRVA